MQGNLAPTLLRAEPERTEQSQEDVEQQEAHAHNQDTHLAGIALLKTAADILEALDVADVEIAYAELLLAVGLQVLHEVLVPVGTDADTELIISINPIIRQQIHIEHHGIAGTCLTDVVVAHILQGGAQTVHLGRIPEQIEFLLTYQRRHRDAVLAIQVVRSQEVAPLQYFSQLLGRLASRPPVTEHTHEVGRRNAADRPAGCMKRIIIHFRRAVTSIVRISAQRQAHHLYLGAATQTLHQFAYLVALFVGIAIRCIIGTLVGEHAHIDQVAMLRVEAAWLQIGSHAAVEQVDDVPHHHAHQQQLQRQPQVAAPFVAYLGK